MGQLLNLGFKNVCNNGNLGNTPNLTPAEIYNLIYTNRVLPQYVLNDLLYAGTLIKSFQLTVTGVGATKYIYGAAGEMINVAFLNAIPDNCVFYIRVSLNKAGSIGGNSSLSCILVDPVGGEFTAINIGRTLQSGFESEIINEFVISKKDLLDLTSIRYFASSANNAEFRIQIICYNFTNQ
jgi:hypothetical protein